MDDWPNFASLPKSTTTLITEKYGIKPPIQKEPRKPVTDYVIKTNNPSQTKIDVSKVKFGTNVTHKTFGKGTVIKIDKNQKHIHIKFAAGEKTFAFPNAFDMGFLKL